MKTWLTALFWRILGRPNDTDRLRRVLAELEERKRRERDGT